MTAALPTPQPAPDATRLLKNAYAQLAQLKSYSAMPEVSEHAILMSYMSQSLLDRLIIQLFTLATIPNFPRAEVTALLQDAAPYLNKLDNTIATKRQEIWRHFELATSLLNPPPAAPATTAVDPAATADGSLPLVPSKKMKHGTLAASVGVAENLLGQTKKRTKAQIYEIARKLNIEANTDQIDLLTTLSRRGGLTMYQLMVLSGMMRQEMKASSRSVKLSKQLAPLYQARFIEALSYHDRRTKQVLKFCRTTPDGETFLERVLEDHSPQLAINKSLINHNQGINTLHTALQLAISSNPSYLLATYGLNFALHYTVDEKNKLVEREYIPDLLGRFILTDPTLEEQALLRSNIQTNILSKLAANTSFWSDVPKTVFGKNADAPGELYWPFLLEYDRATEAPKAFVTKVTKLSDFYVSKKNWPTTWSGTFPTVLVVIDGTTRRMTTLLAATLKQLQVEKTRHYQKVPLQWWFTTLRAFEAVYEPNDKTVRPLLTHIPIWVPVTAVVEADKMYEATSHFDSFIDLLEKLRTCTSEAVTGFGQQYNQHPQRQYNVGLPLVLPDSGKTKLT